MAECRHGRERSRNLRGLVIGHKVTQKEIYHPNLGTGCLKALFPRVKAVWGKEGARAAALGGREQYLYCIVAGCGHGRQSTHFWEWNKTPSASK